MLAHRLVGVCVLSTLTMVAFDLKLVWWQLTLPAAQRSPAVPATVIFAIIATVATIGTWKEKPWGYILAILLCARENIVAVRSFYSYPAQFRPGDIFGLALSGVPVAVGMIAALVLLVHHYSKIPAPNGSSQPTAASRRE